MSVNINPSGDSSTKNANWGTLVVVLVVAIIALVIAAVAYKSGQQPPAPGPTLVNTPAVAAPGPQGVTGATNGDPSAGVSATPSKGGGAVSGGAASSGSSTPGNGGAIGGAGSATGGAATGASVGASSGGATGGG